MKCRPNRFRNLVYDGDWHSRLMSALSFAKDGTGSEEIRLAIEVLEHQLSRLDECLHTVIVCQAIPFGMEPNALLREVQVCIGIASASVLLDFNGCIELTLTARGSREHVESVASEILSRGLAYAKAALWLAINPVNDGRLPMLCLKTSVAID